MRNLQSKVPEDVWPEFKARAATCYQAPSPAFARRLHNDIATTYGKDLPLAVVAHGGNPGRSASTSSDGSKVI